MNVLLINGSPHKDGCTATALGIVATRLEEHGIDTDIFHIGVRPPQGCTACGACRKIENGLCAFDDDCVNDALRMMDQINALIIGSPVYYAGPSGGICSFLDRVFFAGASRLAYKPGAALVSSRRAGSTAAIDRLNKYFTINCMPVVASQYWNEIHGTSAEEIFQDQEGLQILRTLADNMAWMLKCVDSGREWHPHPIREPQIRTSFIR